MYKILAQAARVRAGRIITVLIIAGLTYLTYPQFVSPALSWLHHGFSSTTATTDVRPVSLLAFLSRPIPATVNTVDMQGDEVNLIPPKNSLSHRPLAQSASTPASPTPANQATADYLEALATADASLNRTATPTPPALATAAPTISGASPTRTPEPTAIRIVIVTTTPTAVNIVTVAAQAARATAVTNSIGTYTPVPFNWAVPVIITPEPATAIPLNAATATFQVAEATAIAFVNGTSTPLPINVWTATATPILRLVIGEVATPYLPPTPTATPLPIPQELLGKIVFRSNRSGGPLPLADPLVYVIDPDGSNLAVLNDDTFYRTALARDAYSADQRYLAIASNIRRFDPAPRGGYELSLAVLSHDYQDNRTEQLSFFGAGDAWDPAWSPTRDQVVLVSTETQHAEIWVMNRDGSEPRQLTQTEPSVFAGQIGKKSYIPDDENGHPSWSPDGSRIVFWSSRNGHREIYVMDADGGNLRRLSTTPHDDWDPVWIKYADPAYYPTPILPTDGNF